MYSPDTLQRLNDAAVQKYYDEQQIQNDLLEADPEAIEDVTTCDYCDQPSTQVFPIYNPADSVRNVEGAYSITHVCDECEEKGYVYEETFYCEGCGELFITHHSWDSLVTVIDGSFYCQACAIDEMEPVPLYEVLEKLELGDVGDWIQISAMPDHDLLWEGEYSDYSDFPGNTSLGQVGDSIREAMEEKGLNEGTKVFPLVTGTYQFSCVLGIYLAN